jgi:predicted O-methyltransferase YrrM
MSNQTVSLDQTLYEYMLKASLREPSLFRKLREETAQMPQASMQIAPEQGQFMALLVELLGARRTIEIGTFTGYSALWVASALPPDGELIACDQSEEWTAIARRYWEQACVANKIRLELAPALETLLALLADDHRGTFDFVFIDADKENYDNYYECSIELLRQGGLIAIDNALWSGKVADPAVQDADTQAIRALNEKVLNDVRVSSSLVPIGDGLLLARKR